MRVPLLVLNYNGRRLLRECLPSLLAAAAVSRHDCRVVVVDNASTDDSLAFLATQFPEVEALSQPNRGLCSYNRVLADLGDSLAILLNNDVKLDEGCIDPLVEPLLPGGPRVPTAGGRSLGECFMAAPLCWKFDGATYEGQKTSIAWHGGLVRATSHFPGHEAGIHRAGLTASAGAVMAVDVAKFLVLGGFDPLYLPGTLEDLDLAYRGFLAGYHVQHVPRAVAYHKGQATFGPAFGEAGCGQLALRNTLLFQWKNLRRPLHRARMAAGIPLRLLADAVRAARQPRDRRWAFWRALRAAWKLRGQMRSAAFQPADAPEAERDFFRRFHPHAINGSRNRLAAQRGQPRAIRSGEPVAVEASRG